jgi:hypothetical protein
VAFTAEQQQAIKVALDRHLKKCPICASNAWVLAPDVYFLPVIVGSNINIGAGMPCISAISRDQYRARGDETEGCESMIKKISSAIGWLWAAMLRLAKRLSAPGAGPRLIAG